MIQDLVSIIMPTYNCGPFIARSVDSVLAQTCSNWELLIVDDCSTDNTYEVIEPYLQDQRIQYTQLKSNSGAALARNTALRKAQGQYIAFLDSDDLWLPHKLEHQIEFMKQHHYAFTYHAYDEIDEQSQPLHQRILGKKVVHKLDMYACCWPGCLTVMYDASVIGLIQIRDIKKNNDTAIWLQAIEHAQCHFLPESLALYRHRHGSITPTRNITKAKWIFQLFHQCEQKSVLASLFWTSMNIIVSQIKKTFFVKKI